MSPARTDRSPPDIELLRDEMMHRARQAVACGTEWLSIDQFGAAAERWQQERRIFAIPVGDRSCFPRYALDVDMHPLPAVASVMATLAHYSDDHLASWFESTSSFLGGGRPRELISKDPDRVIAAAGDAVDKENYAG